MGAQHVEVGHEPYWMGARKQEKECTLLKHQNTPALWNADKARNILLNVFSIAIITSPYPLYFGKTCSFIFRFRYGERSCLLGHHLVFDAV